MFVGHYAAAFALKRWEPSASLGLLFLGVQLVDIAFFPLVLLGVERFDLVPHATASTHFELVYMPWTHGLAASFVWGLGAFGLAWAITRRPRLSAAVGLAVLSHWFLDLLVHTPDLPLLGDDSTKLGLGVWRSAGATLALEAGLLVGAVGLYQRGARPRAGLLVFVGALLLSQVAMLFGPPPPSRLALCLSALAAFAIFAGFAARLDRLPPAKGAAA